MIRLRPVAPLISALQRRSESRLDPDWEAAARADPETGYLIAQHTAHLVRPLPETHVELLEGSADLPWELSELTLLGWFEGRRCVQVRVPDAWTPPPPAEFAELRSLLPAIPTAQSELLAYSRALLVWRERHRFCGVCGAPTEARQAGHQLRCTAMTCGAEYFPRIDPAIITLVGAGDAALLGRQASWPPGRYSTLAGFVEAGETLEAAVAREVEEETGVRVESVGYAGSQPWPFPASLMLGFHATAPRMAVRVDRELEDARWFELSELRDGAILLPPRYTIARQLIEEWIESRTTGAER